MTEITVTPEAQTARDEQAARFTTAYIAANRLQYNDAGEHDDPTQVGQWYCEIDRAIPGEGKGCGCGCGRAVTNAKRNFLPGHDQRLMGILVRAHRENLDVMWTDGGMLVGGSGPMDYAELVLNENGQAKLAGYLTNTPKRARKHASTKAIEAAITAGEQHAEVTASVPAEDDFDLPGETPIGPTKVEDIKVGRWTYPARRLQNGVVVRNEKRDGSGDWITVTD